MRPLRPPFHALSAVPLDPHFNMFQFFKTPSSTKITNFTKFVVLEQNFTQNFRSKASNLAKIQFIKPYFFPEIQFFKPYIFFKKISS